MSKPINAQEEAAPGHCGKWSREEEDYVAALIEEFKAGLLPLAEGKTLERKFA